MCSPVHARSLENLGSVNNLEILVMFRLPGTVSRDTIAYMGVIRCLFRNLCCSAGDLTTPSWIFGARQLTYKISISSSLVTRVMWSRKRCMIDGYKYKVL